MQVKKQDNIASLLMSRPLILLVLAFGLGIVAGERYPLPGGWVCLAAGCSGLCYTLIIKNRTWAWARLAVALVSITGAGWIIMGVQVAPVAGDICKEPIQTQIQGRIVSEPEPNDQALLWMFHKGTSYNAMIRFKLAVTSGAGIPENTRLVVYCPGTGKDLRFGDHVALNGMLSPVQPPSSPGQFDFQRYLRQQGISLRMSARHTQRLRSSPAWHPVKLIFDFKTVCRKKLHTLFDFPEATLLDALLLGDRYGLSDEDESRMQRTGVIHFFAISGLHAMFLVGFLWWIGAKAKISRGKLWCITLGVLLAYAIFTGLKPSILRVLAVMTVLAVAYGVMRKADPFSSLAAAAFAVLIWRPYDLFNHGFQLSFLAVSGLILFAPKINAALFPPKETAPLDVLLNKKDRFTRRFGKILGASFAVCCAAWLAVMPAVAMMFHICAPGGILLSLLLMPLIWAILALGPCVLLASLLAPGAGTILAFPLLQTVHAVQGIVRFADAVPGAWFYSPWMGSAEMLFCYGALVCVFFRREIRAELVLRKALIIAMLGLVICMYPWHRESAQAFGVDMIDVSHGNAVLIKTPDKGHILYDCGSMGRWPVGKMIVAPYLWEKKIYHIDLAVLSHADRDHYGGILDLAKRVKIRTVLISPYFEDTQEGEDLIAAIQALHIPVIRASAGDQISGFGNTTIRVLSPTNTPVAQKLLTQNDRSLVLHISKGTQEVLLAGDIETAGMVYLSSYDNTIQSDVIQVPHHGRWAKGINRLAMQTKPTLALVSGRDYPSLKKTQRAFADQGAQWIPTYEAGTIQVRWDAHGATLLK